MTRSANDDPYRVLPHRDVLDCSLYGADGAVIRENYEHVPCGMPLTRREIVDDNWCPHCSMGRQTINKAAKRRANAEWK
jgi:hypothetical protein